MICIILLINCLISSVAARQYLIENVGKIYNNAEDFCVTEYGTHLATITTLDDQINLENLAISSTRNFLFFGLNDQITEVGTNRFGLQFKSGETQTVEFFGDSQPQNSVGNEDCIGFNTGAVSTRFSGRVLWSNIDCVRRTSFACDDAANPRYVAVLDRQLNFADAQQFCRANHNSNLATVQNEREQDYLRRLIAGFDVWIGLNDIAASGQFVWTSRLPVTFTNFTAGEPSNLSDEQCVLATGFTNTGGNSEAGKWQDTSCSLLKNFVCDKNFAAKVGGVIGPIPSTSSPTKTPTTSSPTTSTPTTAKPTTTSPTTSTPTTAKPTTSTPTTAKPTTSTPTISLAQTETPTISLAQTETPTTSAPTAENNAISNVVLFAVGGGVAFLSITTISGIIYMRRRRDRSAAKMLLPSSSASSSSFSPQKSGKQMTTTRHGLNSLMDRTSISNGHYFHQSAVSHSSNVLLGQVVPPPPGIIDPPPGLVSTENYF